jgi:predicted nucleotidyltransferase/DNA-binding transcriptional ArsR family regulator
MMNNNTIIDELFGGPGRTAVLRVLAAAKTPLTGRQIALSAGLSPAGAARALDRLAELGVTKRQPVGRAVLHELDCDTELVSQIIMPAIEAERHIAAARAERRSGLVPADVVSCLVDGFDPLQIILFGSRARGDWDDNSDFDLLVVLPEVADKHATAVAMLVALGHLAVPVDIIPTDPAEIVAHECASATALGAALREGEVVYERVA